jgi:hypothetical protein
VRPSTRLRIGIDPTVLLLGAWALFSVGAATNFGAYTPGAVVLVALGMAALTAAVFMIGTGRPSPRASRTTVVVVGAVAAGCTLVYPYGRYAHGAAQAWSHVLLVVAAGCLLTLALPRRPHRGLAVLMVIAAVGACVAGIIASPAPRNDVWFILQGSSHALLHGRNIYTQTWRGSPPHGITNLYPYLPGTTVLLAPFFLALGDVRYGLVAALVVAAAVVRRLSRGQVGLVLSGLVLLLPRVLFGIEQSWTEPILLALIAAMVWSVETRRAGLATLCLGAALATKQHMLLLLPLAAVWPGLGWRRAVSAAAGAAGVAALWFAAAPRPFVRGVITYNWNLAPRLDSLSLYTSFIRAGWKPPFLLVPVIMVAVVGVALRRLPRTTPGFTLGSAWVLGTFDLLNKQSFFNEWSLVVELVILAVATLGAPAPMLSRRL